MSQVEDYVRELNSLESRRGRKELDVNNVIYWFKNTRAAVKRQSMKDNKSGGAFHHPASAASAAASFMDSRSKSLHLSPHTASQHE